MTIKSKIFMVLLLVTANCVSQVVKNISVNDGLPQSSVSGIVQDTEGLVWISTRNGLAKFDGNNFSVFQSDFKDTTSVNSNLLVSVKRAGKDNLIIQHENGGIDCFNLKTEKFFPLLSAEYSFRNTLSPKPKMSIYSSKNKLWFISGDNLLYFSNSNINYPTKRDLSIYGTKKVFGLSEDKDKQIWILGDNGLIVFTSLGKKSAFVSFPKSFKAWEITGIRPHTFHLHNDGIFSWVAGNHMIIFNPLTNAFTKIDIPLAFNKITLCENSFDGNDFYLIDESIYVYKPDSGFSKYAVVNSDREISVTSALIDQSGLIWLATSSEGLYTIDILNNFKNFDYEADFITDILKKYYKISAVDYFKWREFKGTIAAPSYYFRTIWNGNKHWLASNRSVCYYNRGNRTIVKLPDVQNLTNNRYNPIAGLSFIGDIPVAVDKSGSFFKFDSAANVWELICSLSKLEKQYARKFKITHFFVDTEQTGWLTTESNGLIKIALKTSDAILIRNRIDGLPTNSLMTVTPDPEDKKILWIGSASGLVRFQKDDYNCKVFSVTEGLPGNFIYTTVPCDAFTLWLGTNNGLCSFNTKTYAIKSFRNSYGIKNTEFNRYHQFITADGFMAFGGNASGVMFAPNQIKTDLYTPATAINNIKVNN